MQLVQILLPTRANDGRPFGSEPFAAVRAELTDVFGGVTAYQRAPATGLWEEGDDVVRDDIVVYEVMAETLDRAWWRAYKRTLEQRFQQDEVVIRALAMERL
jgi:hypothetical protein